VTTSSALHRRVRGLLSLAVLGAVTVPLIGWSHAVEVVVDDEVLAARTYAPTVGDVLEELEVEVGPADVVTPPADAPMDEVDTIDIARAITVDVAVDGTVVRKVSAPVSTVVGVLAAADLDLRGEAEIEPAWTEPVEDGDTVHLQLPRSLRLTVDGSTREVVTSAATVGEALEEAGVSLGPDDLVDWDLDTAVQPFTEVVVARVAFDEVVEEVALPYETVRRETEDLRRGVTRVEEEGRDGLRHDVYWVELVDGEEVERELLDREVVREPVDRVVLVGTHVPPPPPPPAPEPAPAPAPRASGTGGEVWDRLARCESGGNWAHRGGRYHGGLQFHPDTWNRHKPSGYPAYAYEATREQQIAVGERVRRTQGWAAWPACSRKLGLR
jgi:resuscitation-promoting factor RpfB